jgi:hypothetical protein
MEPDKASDMMYYQTTDILPQPLFCGVEEIMKLKNII